MEEFKNVDRRSFLKGGLAVAGLNLLQPLEGLAAYSAERTERITILHTNDWHSRIEPFPTNDARYPGLGGAARRAALIASIRASEEHVLVLDAGDIFQGTPYFNFYGGEPEYKLMTQMGYDATTFGNHDFDNGIEGLLNMMPHAGFSFINSNYSFVDTPLEEKVSRYKVFKKGKLKIGVIGVGIDLNGLVPEKNHKGIIYRDPIIFANQQALFLKKELNCHMIICLSHLGYKYDSSKVSDYVLAKESRHIDLIIGGHTHTFLDQPVSVNNLDGKSVNIAQVGWAGIKLGRIDYVYSSKNNTDINEFQTFKVFKKSIVI